MQKAFGFQNVTMISCANRATSLKELRAEYKNLSIKEKLYQQKSCANTMLPLLKDTQDTIQNLYIKDKPYQQNSASCANIILPLLKDTMNKDTI